MTGRMVYYDRQGGRDKYHGQVATGYDDKRQNDPKWTIEQQIIENMLLEAGQTVFDCPVGTGRFIPCYERLGLKWTGMDKSTAMLDQAKAKATKEGGALFCGDILDTASMAGIFQERQFDTAVMCRLTRWLDGSVMGSAEIECRTAIQNLARIANKIIFTIRIDHPRKDIIRPLEWFQMDGWEVSRNEEGVDPTYRIVEMRRA
jgi:ubiquinone/menaquinone biosynthesis C-methylase UbiE